MRRSLGQAWEPRDRDTLEDMEKALDHFDSYAGIIPQFDLFRESLFRPIPQHLRVNRLKADAPAVVRRLEAKGAQIVPSYPGEGSLYTVSGLPNPGNLLEYFLGWIHPQALSSCLTSLALSPQEDACVLDMCAAPGGKAAHMADLMRNTGMIVANELYPSRLRSLGHTLDRLGLLNAVVTGYQAQEFPARHRFDFILADVPCSGEGTFRMTDPHARYRTPPDPSYLPLLQKKILVHGFDLLHPGGRILYATCTYNPEENEAVVHHLLRERHAEILPLGLDCDTEPGITAWKGETYDMRMERAARFYPHRVDTVGFFMARIGKPA